MSEFSKKSKEFSAQFSLVEIPPSLDHVDPEHVADAVRAGKIFVIDVRSEQEFARGHIKGAVNIPMEAFDADAFCDKVKAYRGGNPDGLILFTSLQSPDVDEAAALALVRAWDETPEGNADAGYGFVQLLLGGTFHWLQLYGDDAALTSSYDAAYWTPHLAAVKNA